MHQLVFYGGISIPTGSIDIRDHTPSKQNAKLGYTMQFGSGTTDLNPALTYMGKWERVFWGAQISGIARFYDNRNHYRWGSRYRVTSWLGYRLFTTMYYSCIASARLDWQSWGKLQGNRLFIEGGIPIYQYLEGPQGETTWMVSAGWKFVF